MASILWRPSRSAVVAVLLVSALLCGAFRPSRCQDAVSTSFRNDTVLFNVSYGKGSFYAPATWALQVDGAGSLYVVDTYPSRVPRLQKLTAAGVDITAAFRANNGLNLGNITEPAFHNINAIMLAVDPTTNNVFVTDDGSTLYQLNSSGALLRTVAVLPNFTALTIDAAAVHVLVAANGSILAIDKGTGNVTTTLALPSSALPASRTLTAFVVNALQHVVFANAAPTAGYTVVTGAGALLTTLSQTSASAGCGLGSPMWVNASGTLFTTWTLSSGLCAITAYASLAGYAIVGQYALPPLSLPRALTGDNAGHLWWGDSSMPLLVQYDLTSQRVTRNVSNGLTLFPVGVTADASSLIYQLELVSGCFAQFDSGGSFLQLIPPAGACMALPPQPIGAVDPLGTVLLAVDRDNAVNVVSPSTGALLYRWSPAQTLNGHLYTAPTRIAVDGQQSVVLGFATIGGSAGSLTFIAYSLSGQPLRNVTLAANFMSVDHLSNLYIANTIGGGTNFTALIAVSGVDGTAQRGWAITSLNTSQYATVAHVDDWGYVYNTWPTVDNHPVIARVLYTVRVTPPDDSSFTQDNNLGYNAWFMADATCVHSDRYGNLIITNKFSNGLLKIVGAAFGLSPPPLPAWSSSSSSSASPSSSSPSPLLLSSSSSSSSYASSLSASLSPPTSTMSAASTLSLSSASAAATASSSPRVSASGSGSSAFSSTSAPPLPSSSSNLAFSSSAAPTSARSSSSTSSVSGGAASSQAPTVSSVTSRGASSSTAAMTGEAASPDRSSSSSSSPSAGLIAGVVVAAIVGVVLVCCAVVLAVRSRRGKEESGGVSKRSEAPPPLPIRPTPGFYDGRGSSISDTTAELPAVQMYHTFSYHGSPRSARGPPPGVTLPSAETDINRYPSLSDSSAPLVYTYAPAPQVDSEQQPAETVDPALRMPVVYLHTS